MEINWFNTRNGNTKITEIVKAPFDFIIIGGNPSKDGMNINSASHFDIFLNVSDRVLYSKDKEKPKPDTKYFHVPINENEFWGYEPFMKTKQILDEAYESDKKVYLHCEEGVNRSPTIAAFWLYSRIGNFKEALRTLTDDPEKHERRIIHYQKKNMIPIELPKFYERYKRFGPNLEKILNTKPAIRTDFEAIR